MDITDEIIVICNTAKLNDDADVDVHLLPCCVEHDGPAAVSRFFRPVEATGVTMADGTAPLEVAFRGRRLLGRHLHVPDGYTGLVLEKLEDSTITTAAVMGDPPSKRRTTDAAECVARAEEGCEGEAETEQQANFPQAAQWKAVGQFSSFAYWNHDGVPKAMDGPARCCDWLKIAKELHAPVALEDVEKQLSK